MDKRIRHTPGQIEGLLREAEALAAAGRTQNEIAQTLGISVMTFHRWRKSRSLHAPRNVAPSATQAAETEADLAARFTELQTENGRLRRLVTDLLLEKMRLEDEAAGTPVDQELSRNRLERKVG